MSVKNFFKSGSKISVPALISCLCVLIILGCVVYINVTAGSYNNTYSENEVKISDLETELKALGEQSAVTDEQVSTILYSAADAGNAIAKAQSSYSELNTEDRDYKEKRSEIKDSMTKYFSEDDEGCASQWFYSPDVSYEWRFLSTYSFDTKEIDVIWACYDKDDTVLAICTAVYNVDTGQFTNCNPIETDYGIGTISGTQEETTVVDMDHINDLVNQMS